MPVCKKRKILFIHIAKCAGTSIAKSLNIYDGNNFPPNIEILYGIHENIVLQTLCLEYYKKYIREDLNNYKIFTCVRNPYDRILSDYMWNNRGFSDIFDFCLFVKETLRKKTKHELNKFDSNYYCNHFLPQHECINNTDLKVNIIYFENINQDFEKLFPETKLYHENITNHLNYKDFFKEKKDCVKLINEIYQKDFETFGYSYLD